MDLKSIYDRKDVVNMNEKTKPNRTSTSEMVMDFKRTTDDGEDAMNGTKKKQLGLPLASEIVMDSKSDEVASEVAANTNKMKQPNLPSTSEMVIEAIKLLNSSNGASLEAIKAYISRSYGAKINVISKHIERSVELGVKEGILEQITLYGSFKRFKLKGSGEMIMDLKSTTYVGEDAMNTQEKKQLSSPPTAEKLVIAKSKAYVAEDPGISHEKKQSNNPSTCKMVIESIKLLNRRDGASLGAIKASIARFYGENIQFTSKAIERSVEKCVKYGIIEQVTLDGGGKRFKLKETARSAIKTNPKAGEIP